MTVLAYNAGAAYNSANSYGVDVQSANVRYSMALRFTEKLTSSAHLAAARFSLSMGFHTTTTATIYAHDQDLIVGDCFLRPGMLTGALSPVGIGVCSFNAAAMPTNLSPVEIPEATF